MFGERVPRSGGRLRYLFRGTTLSESRAPTLVQSVDLAHDPTAVRRLVAITASDVGSGVNEVALIVDGAVSARVADRDLALSCSKPYVGLVPCPLTFSGKLPLDFRELVDGPHEFRFRATDAAGNETLSPVAMFSTVGGHLG